MWYRLVMAKFRYVRRAEEETLRRRMAQFPVVAVTGPRQSGKSTMLERVPGRKARTVSLELPSVLSRAEADPELFLENLGTPAVIDEIQNLPALLPVIKHRVDQARQRPGQYVLSGSQQFQMMRGLAETLAGRVSILNLMPFDATEWPTKERPASARTFFLSRCLKGAYPRPAVMRGLDAEAWFEGYIATYLERDVRGLHNIGNLRDFRRFMVLAAARIGQIFNMSHFSQELGVSGPTIRSGTSVLEASHIVFLLPPYHRNFGKRIIRSPKLYFVDVGLALHLAGIRTAEHLLQGPMAGAAYENFVVQEILKTHLHQGYRPNLYFWRSSGGHEVDILIERDGRLTAVECKLSSHPRPVMAAALEQFIALSKEPRRMPAFIVAPVEESIALTRQVRAVDIRTFLGTQRG